MHTFDCIAANRVRLASLLAIASLVLMTAPNSASAEDWMYRRSYFSHVPVHPQAPVYPVPASRSAYRPAIDPAAHAIRFRSEWSWDQHIIQNGPRVERTWHQEGFLQFQP
jgi:hypothetical protein